MDALYELLKDRMSVLEYEHWKQEFEIETLIRDGKFVAVLQHKGPEFHFFTFGGYKFTKSDVVEVLSKVIAKHGYVTTKTPISDTRQHRFNLRLGFKQSGVDNEYVYYKLDSI